MKHKSRRTFNSRCFHNAQMSFMHAQHFVLDCQEATSTSVWFVQNDVLEQDWRRQVVHVDEKSGPYPVLLTKSRKFIVVHTGTVLNPLFGYEFLILIDIEMAALSMYGIQCKMQYHAVTISDSSWAYSKHKYNRNLLTSTLASACMTEDNISISIWCW